MGRHLEPYSITVAKSISKQIEQNSSRRIEVKPKKTIQDEILNLKKILLEKLKSDTSISKTNHIIEVVTHIDEDNIERLYFHVQNMLYGEYHPQQQDCYGRIDERGLVELFKSREPSFYNPDKETEEAFSTYTPEEIARKDDFKRIVEEGLESINKENKEWDEKGFFSKTFSKISSKNPRAEEMIKDFLLRLPEHLREFKKEPTLVESIRVNPNEQSNSQVQKVIDNDMSQKKEDEMQI